jgi:polyisoprenoid-binding protein YceI
MLRTLTLAAVAGLALPSVAPGSTWTIDPAHTSAQFAVRHLMVSTVRGEFGKVAGTATVDDGNLTKSSVEATIDAGSIDTRNEKRDQHLKSPDFLDVARHPTIAFKSKKVERVADARFKVTGDLTLHGVTKEVVLDVEGSPVPLKDPFGNVKLGGTATTRINRRDFGIVWNKALETGGVVVGDEVQITIDVELVKQASGG